MKEDLDIISDELYRKLEKILDDFETSSSKSNILRKAQDHDFG